MPAGDKDPNKKLQLDVVGHYWFVFDIQIYYWNFELKMSEKGAGA